MNLPRFSLWLEGLKASPWGRLHYRLKQHVLALGRPLRQWLDARYLRAVPARVEALSRKPRIRVLFWAMHPAYWRADSLYRAMREHPRFEPLIVVCGSVERGREAMLRDTEEMARHLERQGLPFLRVYDPQTDRWANLRHEFDPDLLLYAKPYTGLLPRAYEFDRFLDKLFLYLPYGIQTTNLPELCDTRYSRLSWMQFYETPLVFKHSPILERNTRITGSPKADAFLRRAQEGPASPWKPQAGPTEAKRVIWAPHHSIGGGSLAYSNFLLVADDFLALAQRMAGQVQFAFKPHPLLRTTLYAHKDWGRERTDAYYRAWAEAPNLQFEDGDYVDLFLTSDALIHDCGSFTVEYLMTCHPALYLAKSHHEDTLNGFGREAFALHYQGSTMADVEHFLRDTVLGGDDPLAARRKAFFRNHLMPPHGRTAAENMIHEILKFNT